MLRYPVALTLTDTHAQPLTAAAGPSCWQGYGLHRCWLLCMVLPRQGDMSLPPLHPPWWCSKSRTARQVTACFTRALALLLLDPGCWLQQQSTTCR
jgi:hypothetical protein